MSSEFFDLADDHTLIPLTFEEYLDGLNTGRYARMSKSLFKTESNGVKVSTIFTYLNYWWHGGDSPADNRNFETMVFGGKFNHLQKSYATYDEAKTGHELICAEVFANE